MTSTTSIPAYLWRNTLKRWLENPAAPATKFLVPFLFGVVAITVSGLLRGVERELESQLARADLRALRTSEFVGQEQAAASYHAALEIGSPWKSFCEQSDLILQAPLTGTTRILNRLPVLAYVQPPSFVELPASEPGDPRPSLILGSSQLPNDMFDKADYIKLGELAHLPATFIRMPAQLESIYQAQAIALVPAELLEPALTRSHTRLQLLVPHKDLSTRDLENMLRAHARNDEQDLRVFSSLGVIDELNRMTQRQQFARILLGIGIAAVMSLILGSLTFLEFRQELYLIALLRSFGIKASNLFFHYLAETAVIAFPGGLAAYFAVSRLVPALLGNVGQNPDLRIPFSIANAASADLAYLFSAMAVGVILSTIPLLPGLRKPAGLFLP